MKILKKGKGRDIGQAFYFYGQNPNHRHWEEMTSHLLAAQKRQLRARSKEADLKWTLPLIWGLLYSRNDVVLYEMEYSFKDVYDEMCKWENYVACMRQVLARPDAVEFIMLQRARGFSVWDHQFYSLMLVKSEYHYNEPTNLDGKVVRGYFELLDKDIAFREELRKHVITDGYSLGKFHNYSAKTCCALLEQLRKHFQFEGMFDGDPFDKMEECVKSCDAETLKRCFALGFWEIHLKQSSKSAEETRGPLQFSAYYNLNNPGAFEATWDVLVEHSHLNFSGMIKRDKFYYAIEIEKHWALPVIRRFKELLKRDSDHVRGAKRMLQVIEAVESVDEKTKKKKKI